METSDSMPPEMESPGEDIMLIETVKRIVTRGERNESEGTDEDFFLMSQDQSVQYPEGTVSATEVTLAWMHLCRICANASNHMIPIFEGDGAEHDLSSKIIKYLPIHVSESDTLPLQLCENCANILIAWHDLREGCLSAEIKLLAMQDTQLRNKQQYYNPTSLDNLEVTTPMLTTASTTIESNITNPLPNQQDNDKNEACDSEKINKSNRSCGVRIPFRVSPDTPKAFWKPYRKQCQSRMRNLTKPSATAEDSDSGWIAVMDTMHDHPSTVSEQLESNDQSVEPKEEYVAPLYSDSDEDSKELCRVPRTERCAECGRCFKLKDSLLRHMRIHKAEYVTTQRSVKNSDCDEDSDELRTITVACEEKISERDQTLNDNSTHLVLDDEKDSKELCEIPGNALHREETFRCAECGRCFKLKDSYLRHMRIHKNERPFTCHVCGKQFRDSGGLTRHLKDVHAKLKNFTCDLCKRSFASKATREDHRRTHTGERPYVCDSCGKTFKSKASLYIHSKLHTDVFPHACSYCNKRFRRRQEVLAHVTTHTGEKNHGCDVCERKFRVKSELARHKLIHSENKPFVCVKCGLAFRQKRYLNNHLKSRHKESLRAS
ncbi:uncharacterized protein [Temnothorax longispinosus]|uniref:uncharacterized protein n=1 Tax=Temnothorax longispinosus TaxID=300112 RepID=UPI003A9A4986